jgi:hypothetical protein
MITCSPLSEAGCRAAFVDRSSKCVCASQDKTTPLFISAIGGHVDVVRALIEAGAELDVECGDSAVTEVQIAGV